MAILIRLLGPLEALVDDTPVALGPPQQRTLVALLALSPGKPVTISTIEEALWEETPPPTAAKIVQTYVSRLRKLLGADAIQFLGHGYALSSDVEVDVDSFRQLVDEGRYAEALSLWRGRALADVPALHTRGRQLDELRATASEERFNAELDKGEGPALVAELEALVDDHPNRERLLAQLVLALYRSGRQTDALDAYRHGRDTLVESFGLEPGTALRDLERQILQQDPALLPPRTGYRPVALAHPRRRTLIAVGVFAAAAAAAAIGLRWTAFGQGTARAVSIHANSLLELDPRTNRFVGSIPIGRDAAALVATADAVWVASERERTVTRIDLATDQSTTIGEPHPVAFLAHDDRGNIYASGWDFPFIWQIDPHTVQIARQYRVTNHALGLSIGGGSLWAVNRFANSVTRIDLAQRRVADTIHVGANPLASTFGYGALWVANGDSGTVAVIRPGAPPILVRAIPSPSGISAGDGGVWVASTGMHAIYRIDPDTHATVARIDLGTPTDLLANVSAGPHGVWAVENHHVVRIDPADDRVILRIRFPPGTEPKAAVSTDKLVWIAVGNPKDDM
jgi:DNA-binding SARP family transcriptional activator/streptogramin lyase